MGKYEYSFLSQLDIFGIPPLFTIRGRRTFQTQIGSSLTILCIILILIYMSVFFNQMINHKSPDIQSIVYYDEIPEVELYKNDFLFVFSLQTKEFKNYIDESIYKVEAYYTQLTLKSNGIYNLENIPLKITKCNEYNFELLPFLATFLFLLFLILELSFGKSFLLLYNLLYLNFHQQQQFRLM